MSTPSSYALVLYDATLVTLASSSPATVSNGGNKEKMCRSGEAEIDDLGVKHRFGVVVDASGTITHVMPTGALRTLVKGLKEEGVRFDRGS